MAKNEPASQELSRVVSATLTAVDQVTPWAAIDVDFAYRLRGTFVASLRLETSDDGGTTADPCTILGAPQLFSAPCSEVGKHPENGILIRWRVVSFTSGSILARISY